MSLSWAKQQLNEGLSYLLLLTLIEVHFCLLFESQIKSCFGCLEEEVELCRHLKVLFFPTDIQPYIDNDVSSKYYQ